MLLNRYANWIGNSDQETLDHPAELGYWVVYQICKAYFDRAVNKQTAVSNMLQIKDYQKFLTESKVNELLLAKQN